MTVEAFIRDEPGPARLELDDFGGGWLAIAFFPPGEGSRAELARFEELRGAFADAECLLLGASVDSWFELRDAPAGFPLVADTRGLLSLRFGAVQDGEPRPGTVLIDPDGRVRFDDLGEGVSADRALEALRRLQDDAAERAAA